MLNPLPNDFIESLVSLIGADQLDQFKQALHGKPSLSIRANPFKNFEFINTNPVPWCSQGQYLDERPSFTLDPSFHAGAYYVQEASSMFLECAFKHAINPLLPIKALDLCAAPGGKSTHLLSLLNQQSILISNEALRSRAHILSENIQKWGSSNVMVTQNDPAHFSPLTGYFDLIVVDAPCSGEGMFRKEPESIGEWSKANVDLCSQRQRRILANVFPALKQDGILIYCTCTYNRTENDENLTWLSQQNELEFLSIPINKEWGIEETNEHGIIGYRFFPHRVGGEGFFLSMIKKRGKEQEVRFRNKDLYSPGKTTLEKLKPWLKSPDGFDFISHNVEYNIIPKDVFEAAACLAHRLNVIQIGTPVGTVKHDKMIPAHGLAISNALSRENIKVIELSKSESLQYLRKEPQQLPNAGKGFALMTHGNLGLGWINGLDNRYNNLYPTNWRIRMK